MFGVAYVYTSKDAGSECIHQFRLLANTYIKTMSTLLQRVGPEYRIPHVCQCVMLMLE